VQKLLGISNNTNKPYVFVAELVVLKIK